MIMIDEELFEAEIVALEEKARKHKNSKNLIAFYGSSSIRLWPNLKQDLDPLNVINMGFGGSSYPYCLHYFERIFQHLNPSQMVLYAGDNDLGHGGTIMEVFYDFKNLILEIQRRFPGIPIHVISIKPSPSRQQLVFKTSEANALLRNYILGTKNGKWIEIFSKMLNEGNKTQPELFIEDQLHLNDKGYDIWRKVVKAHLMKNNSPI
ncbi:MAG: GDSL family lipase [Cyclobacteriaceae bacterium]